jgi:hypothetical protein
MNARDSEALPSSEIARAWQRTAHAQLWAPLRILGLLLAARAGAPCPAYGFKA